MGRWTAYHPGVFLLTFISYALYHIARKTPSYVQSSLISEWTPPSPRQRPSMGDASQEGHHGRLFRDAQSAEAFVGILNAIFLFVYAAGNVVSGMAADRLDPRVVLTMGMTLSAVVMFVFGPGLEWSGGCSKGAYIILQVVNAVCQSTGWPCVVPVMANWFDRRSRGYLLGLWSSSSSVGGILGALAVSAVVGYGYEYAFLLTSSLLFAGGVLVFFGLVTSPYEVGLTLPVVIDEDRCIGGGGGDGNSEVVVVEGDDNVNNDVKGEVFSKGEREQFPQKRKPLYKGCGRHKSCSGSDLTNAESKLKVVELTRVRYQDLVAQRLIDSTPVLCVASERDQRPFPGLTAGANEEGAPSKLPCDDTDKDSNIRNERIETPRLSDGSDMDAGFKSSFGPGTGQETPMKEDSEDATKHAEPKAISFCGALLLPGVIPYTICFSFLKMVVYVFFFWLPRYLASSHGWSEAEADRLSLWYDVGALVGATVSSFLMSRLNKSALVITPMLLTSVLFLYAYGVAGLGRDMTANASLLFCLGSLLSGVGNQLSAAVSADLAQLREASRAGAKTVSTVTGIMEGSGTVAAAMGQVGVPRLCAAFGWDWVFYFLMGATCMSAVSLCPVLAAEVRDVVRGCRTR